MAATADQLSALGNDTKFQQRVKSLLVQQAGAVYAQGSGATGYAYAKQILQGNINFINVTQVLVNRTNLVASNVTYNFASGCIVTDATDAAIQNQIGTDWAMLAGV